MKEKPLSVYTEYTRNDRSFPNIGPIKKFKEIINKAKLNKKSKEFKIGVKKIITLVYLSDWRSIRLCSFTFRGRKIILEFKGVVRSLVQTTFRCRSRRFSENTASGIQIVPEWPPVSCKLFPSGRKSDAKIGCLLDSTVKGTVLRDCVSGHAYCIVIPHWPLPAVRVITRAGS